METIKEQVSETEVASDKGTQEQLSGILFKREWLASYGHVLKPGKYLLACASNVTEANLIVDEKTGRKHYIVSFKAIPIDQLENVKKVFKDRIEVPIEETTGLFLSGNAWMNNRADVPLPMKGEKVEVIVDYVENREGVKVLRPISLRVKQAAELEPVDVSKMFAPSAEERADIVSEALADQKTLETK